ncbi:MAG: hypothetical protein Q8O19_07780, partial [Rectinemataceae bacterium]|nr:hypothetical protein [Rectinemataceae bacterium]
MSRRIGAFLLTTLVFAVPVSSTRGDVVFPPLPPSGPTLVAEHGGVTIDDSFFDGSASIDGAQLSGVNEVWNVGFPGQWSQTPVPPERAVIGIFEGGFWSPSYPLIQGRNFSFAHTAINSDTATTTVSIPAPLLGDPDTPSGIYTLFVYELPATKSVCQDVEPYDCFEEPYTDQDFIDYLTTDPNQPDAPFTYPPLGARFIIFSYIGGEAPHSCTTNCFSNVLFLPGIEASRLYRPDYSGGTVRLWEPDTDSDVRDLYMNPDGTSANFDIYTKDIMSEAYGTLGIYQSFLADLNGWK